MIIEDFDEENQKIPTRHSEHETNRNSSLFRTHFMSRFDIARLSSPHTYSKDHNFQKCLKMLVAWNRSVDEAVRQVGWRARYHAHQFIYSSLMTIMFQPMNVGTQSLLSLVEWLNKLSSQPRPTCYEPKREVSDGQEEALIRQTFKSELPACIDQISRRRFISRQPKIKAATSKQWRTGSADETIERADLRLYVEQHKKLRQQKQNNELEHLRQSLKFRRTVMMERSKNASSLLNSVLPRRQSNEHKDIEQLNNVYTAFKELKNTNLVKKYRVLVAGSTNKLTLKAEEKPQAKFNTLQGLTLIENPLVKKKVLRQK